MKMNTRFQSRLKKAFFENLFRPSRFKKKLFDSENLVVRRIIKISRSCDNISKINYHSCKLGISCSIRRQNRSDQTEGRWHLNFSMTFFKVVRRMVSFSIFQDISSIISYQYKYPKYPHLWLRDTDVGFFVEDMEMKIWCSNSKLKQLLRSTIY